MNFWQHLGLNRDNFNLFLSCKIFTFLERGGRWVGVKMFPKIDIYCFKSEPNSQNSRPFYTLLYIYQTEAAKKMYKGKNNRVNIA